MGYRVVVAGATGNVGREILNILAAISNRKIIKNLYFIDELNTQNTLDKNQLIFLQKHHNIKKKEIMEF